MPKFLTLDDFDVKDKTVLVRVDFNSPVDPETKKVLSDARIRAHGETTIKELAEKGAKVVILAHQGRPGEPDFISLEQHAQILGSILGRPVKFVDDVCGEKAQKAIKELKSGEILVLDNVRKFPGERKKASPEEHSKSELVMNLAPLADLFVNDAFAAAHRAHASIVGFTVLLPSAAGRIMERELKALSRVLESPEKPCVFILGGAKADDSLQISKYVLDNNIADYVLTGGITGHLFLAAKGYDLGKPNMELLEKKELMGLIPGIKELMEKYPGKIETPVDLAIEVEGKRKEITIEELPTEYPIYDIGTKTIERYGQIISNAKSIVFSGPPGVYEKEEFVKGTRGLFEAIANSSAFSLVGGGHSVAAVHSLGLADKMGYISTAGGALIEFLMGKELPGVAALERAASRR
ncbi:MAG TPA: phosphoglycerate kinase [Candidatus Bathyarchaeota archaeon]|nr:phosphoglycerate kinase [Candidatus Bathyarchaeota archaeon]HEX68667.1 phosphoglycerate kinase [Candidatus Bathyarchaeota archaeon]